LEVFGGKKEVYEFGVLVEEVNEKIVEGVDEKKEEEFERSSGGFVFEKNVIGYLVEDVF
jgi:hypothetical protein